jgi:hypothetical protein
MAAKTIKRHAAKEWLSSDVDSKGMHAHLVVHENRWVEVKFCDYEQPKDRLWTITMIDRETYARATVTGRHFTKVRDLAMEQVGMPPLPHKGVAERAAKRAA